MRLLFFIILFGVGYLLYHLYGKKMLRDGPKGMLKIGLIVLGVLLVLAVLTGRANPVFAVIGGLFASAFRFLPMLIRFYPQVRDILGKLGFNLPGGPGNATLTTATLALVVNHSTGQMDGNITGGPFQGKALSAMNLSEIEAYYGDCKTRDPDALRLIETYVRRTFPDQWRTGSWSSSQQNAAAGNSSALSMQEARAVLGVSETASKQEITYAHRQLMAKLHPDKGGNDYLATRVNQAKDLLISSLKD